jgi:5-methylcytosine-specific restriction endonuclease McrA
VARHRHARRLARALTSPSRYANGAARRKVRAWLRGQGLPCHLCGRAIDYSLPAGHPMSFEVDEIVPVSKGGSPIDRSNVAPAHRICNERRGNKPMRKRKPSDGTRGAPGAGPRPCDLKTEDATRF